MPIIDVQRRLHPAGRIRLGDRQETSNGGKRPAKLSEFRFTSSDESALNQVATTYGGTVVPWDGNGSGDKYELYTTATTLNVILPPEELSFSQWYEDWNGGVCRHRCDGVDDIKTDHQCSCDPENRSCKPTTRLGVILQEVSGIGLWRLETHGWSAAAEIGGTIDLLRALQTTKPIPARLLLREDTRKALLPDGKVTTHHFVVPVLDPNLSISQLTAGAIDTPRLATGVTAIHPDEPPTLSVAEQIQTESTPPPKRANSAAALPSTGLPPRPAAAVVDATPTYEPPADAPLVTEPQGKNIGRLFGKIGIKAREERLDFLVEHFNHPFDSSSQLLKTEASQLITMLKVLAGEEDTPRPTVPARTVAAPPLQEPSQYDNYSDEEF